MGFAEIIVIVGCAALAIAFVLNASVHPPRASATRRWIAKRQAPITPAVGTVVERRLAQRSFASGIGALIGLAIAIGLLRTVGADTPTLGVWVVVILTIAGGAVGLGVPAFHSAVRPVTGIIRVAHSSAARISDFINPTAVRLVRGSAALAVIAALVSALLPFWRGPGFGPDRSGAVWVGLVALLLSWAAAEFAVRRLLDQPQPSAGAVELVWDDAIRGQLFGDLFSIPCSLAIAAAALSALADASTVPAPYWTFPFLIGILLVTPITMVTALVVLVLGNGAVQSRRSAAIAAAQGV